MKRLTEKLQAADDRADLTPLIDCVFLLLLFFIVTAVFVEESNLFEINLPVAAHAEVRRLEEVVVVGVSKAGRLSVGESFVSDDQLWAHLDALNSETPIQTLIIQGDRECPYEKVVMAMDVAQALGVDEITLAVERE